MANPMKGESQLGDHTLVFNFGAFCALEEKAGKKMPALLAMLQEGLGFTDLRDFVWAGTRARHPELTDDGITALLDETGFEVAALAVGKGVSSFFGSQREKAKNPPKAA